jgi:uncharacterized pyridoxamine 5'-phosphate oxidase family protein
MNTRKEFNRIMTEQNIIALATSVDDCPNVRVVNFYYDTEQEGILFFSTFKDNKKVNEFLENNKVAFTTIPKTGNQHVRATGQIRRSSLSVYDFKEEFEEKSQGYSKTIENFGENLVLFELHFESATVILDFTQSETFYFK